MILDLHCKNWEAPVILCAQVLVFKGFEVTSQGFGKPFSGSKVWPEIGLPLYSTIYKMGTFWKGGSNLSFGGGGGWVRCIKTFKR